MVKKMIKHNIVVVVVALMATLVGCAKDGQLLTTPAIEGSDLYTSTLELNLGEMDAEELALTLNWTDNGNITLSDEAVAAPENVVTNTVEFSLSESFEGEKVEVATEAGAFAYQWTTSELNTLLLRLGVGGESSQIIYIRVCSRLGANMEPSYSNIVSIKVSVFAVDMSVVRLRDKNSAELYHGAIPSVSSNRYEGLVVTPSTWLNFYFQEGDNTLWGNSSTNGTFAISTDASMWNCWFPEPQGLYWVTMDKSACTWSAMNITQLTATTGSGSVLFVVERDGDKLTAVVEASPGESITIAGRGNLYDVSSGDASYATTDFVLDFSTPAPKCLTSGTATPLKATAAGTQTIIVELSDSNYWSIKAGDADSSSGQQWPEDSSYVVPTGGVVSVVSEADASQVWSKLAPANSATLFEGYLYADKSKGFLFTDGVNTYGAAPVAEGANRLYHGADRWACRVANTGYYRLKADFTDAVREWSVQEVESIDIVGDFNQWALGANRMVYDKSTGLWSADIDPAGSWGEWGIHFVFNEDWSWCLNDGDVNGTLESGTTDFMPTAEPVASKVTIDLRDASAMTYTIVAK